MFNWLGNLFPYSDLHSLNLDWVLSKMKETAAQAAKAVADAANALAQVAEAKAAALSAQTAAEDAQTAANKAAGNAANAAANAVQALNAAQTAQETATAANNKAQTAQETATAANSAAQTAQSAAQTAQSTANTAQSAAQTAQNTANTAQNTADSVNSEVTKLKKKFPVDTADIASRSVTVQKLFTVTSYLKQDTSGNTNLRFPENGIANLSQITSGIENRTNAEYFYHLKSEYLQINMDIIENGSTEPNTVFSCTAPLIHFTKITSPGLLALAPIILIKKVSNEMYNGFIKLSRLERTSDGAEGVKIEVIFETTPPFNDNTAFVITVYPLGAELSTTP